MIWKLFIQLSVHQSVSDTMWTIQYIHMLIGYPVTPLKLMSGCLRVAMLIWHHLLNSGLRSPSWGGVSFVFCPTVKVRNSEITKVMSFSPTSVLLSPLNAGFLEKNRDVLNLDIITLIQKSSSKLLRHIFETELNLCRVKPINNNNNNNHHRIIITQKKPTRVRSVRSSLSH